MVLRTLLKRSAVALLFVLVCSVSNGDAISLPDALVRAKNGDHNSQSYLGHIYLCGEGVEQNPTIARFWYEKVLKQPDADAKIKAHTNLMLGLLYKSGKGGLQCYKTAMKCFMTAAEQGYTDAHLNIGLLYAQGLGVKKDYDKALYWWNLAAKKGHPGAPRYVAALKKTYGPNQKTAKNNWSIKAAKQ